MPSYDLTGTVKHIMDPQTFNSGFTKRDFVVTTEDDRYPQDIKLECLKAKCSLLDRVAVGQRVNVRFDLRGNESKDRFFVNLAAWRIEPAEETAAAPDDAFPPMEDMAPIPDNEDAPPSF